LSIILFFSLIALAHQMFLIFTIGLLLCGIDFLLQALKSRKV